MTRMMILKNFKIIYFKIEKNKLFKNIYIRKLYNE